MFRDRRDAGRQLAERLRELRLEAPLVLALPRGGVPVGYEVATALDAPLVVHVARKVGAPRQPELAVGAVSEGLDRVVVTDAAARVGLRPDDLDALARAAQQEVDRRVERYRGGRPLPPLAGRHVVLVDDGLATGATAEAALRALRGKDPARLVLAVPVCAPTSVERLRAFADDVVCVLSPPGFGSVGSWYDDFDQTTDEEVLELVARRGS